jgi:hypothetical protein
MPCTAETTAHQNSISDKLSDESCCVGALRHMDVNASENTRNRSDRFEIVELRRQITWYVAWISSESLHKDFLLPICMELQPRSWHRELTDYSWNYILIRSKFPAVLHEGNTNIQKKESWEKLRIRACRKRLSKGGTMLKMVGRW